MASLLRKLQEVTNLTDTASTAPTAPAAASSLPITVEEYCRSRGQSLEQMPAADAAIIRGIFQDWQQTDRSWTALKSECQAVQDEYAAYKLKVQSWRQQIKEARAQDRKTIELLRQQGGNAAAGSAPTGLPPAHVEGAASPSESRPAADPYVTSLEEQVKMLKETVRETADRRDELSLELKRLRGKLEETCAVGGTSSAETTTQNPLITMRLQEVEEELHHTKRLLEDAEQTNGQLQKEANDSAAAALEAAERHKQDLAALEERYRSSASSKYIADLEKELSMYRAEWSKREAAAAANSTHDAQPAPNSAAPREPATAATAQREEPRARFDAVEAARREAVQEGRMAAMQKDLRERNDALEQIRVAYEEQSSELVVVQETVEHLYEETKQLRGNLEQERRAAEQLREEISSLNVCLEQTNRDLQEAKRVAAAGQEDVEKADKVVAKLQKEAAERNEQVRKLRNELLQLQVEHSTTLNVLAPNRATPKPTEKDPALGAHSLAPNYAANVAALLARPRMRIYLVIAAIALIVVLTGFYYSAPIVTLGEDALHAETLKKCEEQLRLLRVATIGEKASSHAASSLHPR